MRFRILNIFICRLEITYNILDQKLFSNITAVVFIALLIKVYNGVTQIKKQQNTLSCESNISHI